ncbi:hypothetical protein CXP54_18890 [Escherichia albertii]|uniref:Uncharacterized protein n=1 Tax=Escherichia albertii TaxID=208962 RepID=A0ABX5HGR5_ESCAL|nr:hypothetical protein CXP54_18890 [Escherichia albertii]EAB1453153.1 hypothetical protein [Escherichia albertii]EEW6709782.1 hypothetical protein [Escherichia albertii]EEW7342079.1 hypothetical protein [Escherichia albertii]EEW7499427.1 hypothetical protein [Escherichia albertii]
MKTSIQPTGIYANGEIPQTKIKKTSNGYLQQRNLCYANITRTIILIFSNNQWLSFMHLLKNI